MKITIKATGFEEGAAALAKMGKNLGAEVAKDVGNQLVEAFQKRAKAGGFFPPKLRGKGPTLIDTGEYVGSWKVVVKGSAASVGPQGAHSTAGMSNSALGELLEYGHGDMAPRPHMRLMALWLKANVAKIAGKAVKRVLGST